MDALMRTDLPLPVKRGKVRDVYDLGNRLLIVATDRISAFDCVMPNGVPGKGKILTALSRFWFEKFADVEHHLISTDVDDLPASLAAFREMLRGRIMISRKADVVPIECVARGYLVGSGWKEYQSTGTVCGIALPSGLRICDRLPQPIFTPATKEESGHDVNVSFADAAARVSDELLSKLSALTLALYRRAAAHALSRGVILADTKFEFGLFDGRIILIDEVLTPDSSRFWPAEGYTPGRDQPCFDKQFVRNYLESTTWDKTPPAPELPAEIVAATRSRYVEAFELLTEQHWDG